MPMLTCAAKLEGGTLVYVLNYIYSSQCSGESDSLEHLLLVAAISSETISPLTHISSNLDCSDYFKSYHKTMAFECNTNDISDPIN